MPVVNDSSDSHLKNANMTAAQGFEARVTDPIESGKEVVGGHGQNATSPANTFEARFTQETGTH